MKYLEWNNAIINHYFNVENEEKEIILYFSERIIVEIGQKNFDKPEDGYVNDFYRALRIGVPGTSKDYIQRIIELENKFNSGIQRIDGVHFKYPPYFTYLLAFILPFTSGETIEYFSASNFYGYVNNFFKKKNIILESYNFNSNRFREIDDFLERINNWLIEINSFQFGYLEPIHPPSSRKYVGKYAYHILFRKEQEERLSTIFDKEDLLPNESISIVNIKLILLKYADELNLNNKTQKQIKNNDYFGELIIKRALKYHSNWDGTNYDNSASKGYSRAHLIMCVNLHRITKKIELTHFRIFTNKGIPENSILRYNEDEISDVKLISEKYSNPILININLEEKEELIDLANRVKYTFKPKEFHIFKNSSLFEEWIEIPKVEFNVGKTLIIVKRNFYDDKLRNWFENIANKNKKLLDNNEKTGLSNNWIAITIKAITSYPHNEIDELSPNTDDKPKINFDRSFYDNGNFFIDQLPLVWVDNIDTDEIIYAVYENDDEIKLSRKIEEQMFFSFTDSHIERKNKKFKLICGDIMSKRYYQIVDFKKTSNNDIEILLPKRNSTGKIIDDAYTENYLRGIEPFFNTSSVSNYRPLQNLLDNKFVSSILSVSFTSNESYNKCNIGNIIINYISTKGKLLKQDFDNAVFTLIGNIENDDIQKTANYLRYSLQDSGFIDYDTRSGKITVNKPQLLIKPSKNGIITFLTGARDNEFVEEIIDYCSQNNIVVEIQDNNDILHPQIIYIKFKNPNIESVKALAKKFDLTFKKYNLHTQFALASFFPDISKWNDFIEMVNDEIKDFPGGLIFDINNLTFVPKPENFNRNLSFIKYVNINGYKTVYRLWFGSISYVVEEQQLGIYIYLYLFKKLTEDNFNECKKNIGWNNCGDEQELMDNAKKITNVIVYDRNRKYLAVPLNCRLPRNLSISIALLNGQKPDIEYLDEQNIRNGMYIIYKNVPSLFLSNTINLHLLKKGLQSLNNTAINIEL